jgi:hypothetical protein
MNAMKMSRSSFRLLLVAIACTGWMACGDDDTDADRDGGEVDAGGHDGGHDSGASGSGGQGSDRDAALADASTGTTDACIGICDDGGTEDEDGGGVPAADFYPVTNGSHWVYRHNGGTPWDEKVDLTTTKYKGHSAYLLQDSAGPSGTHGKTILSRQGDRILRIHRDEYDGDDLTTSTDYDPGFVRFSYAWPRAKVGSVETLSYTREERDALGEVTADGNRSHTYTIKSHDAAVSVPAGDFEDCLEVVRSRVRMPGQSAGEGDEDAFWFCPGVGKVREQDLLTGETEELVSCDVPGGDCP